MIDLVPCRRAIISGLIGTFLFRITKTDAAHRTLSIPKFESGRYQFTTIQPRRKLPSLTLFRLDGRTTDLSSLRGRPILLNFWATWCAACRTELPILDRLQAERRHTGLQILAVSEDRAERATVERFVRSMKIQELAIYRDPNGYVASSDASNSKNAPFSLYGMPITYAIAASGWVVGYMPGAADWTSTAAAGLIEFLHHA